MQNLQYKKCENTKTRNNALKTELQNSNIPKHNNKIAKKRNLFFKFVVKLTPHHRHTVVHPVARNLKERFLVVLL